MSIAARCHLNLLLVTVLLCTGRAAAQTWDLPAQAELDEIPEELSLVPDGSSPSDALIAPRDAQATQPGAFEQHRSDAFQHEGLERVPAGRPSDERDLGEVPLQEGPFAGDFPMPAVGAPPLLVNSGSYVRPGLWYARGDLALMQRFNSDEVVLAFATGAGGVPEGNPLLLVDRGSPGVSAMTRLTLGRYFSRDAKNRDHMAEVVFFGLGEWDASKFAEAETPGNVAGSGLLASILDPFADRLAFRHRSFFNSYELNYVDQGRLGADQLVLHPQGTWSRRLREDHVYAFLAGFRVFQLNEDFTFASRGSVLGDRTDQLFVRTNNVLVGVQAGGELLHQQDRWNVGVRGKVGPYVNFSWQTTDRRSTVVDPFAFRTSEEVLAFVGELSVFSTFDILPELSFRVAYEAMWVNAVAVASEQFRDPDVLAGVDTAGNLMFQGLSLRLEYFW